MVARSVCDTPPHDRLCAVAPRLWQFYKQPGDVFGVGGEDRTCRSDTAAAVATVMILQSSGKPLIDRDLNCVVFDTRMNDRTERYIVANDLDSVERANCRAMNGETGTGVNPIP